jgi:3(or 17)beta-hydroxysteroid dehydrogenase
MGESAVTGRLQGKVALVTGGTSGIGAGTVERLAAEGARVVFTGSNEAAADALCTKTGAQFRAHRVQEAAAWPGLMEGILAEHGRLDIAFANAGTEAGDASVEDIAIEGWDNVVAVNQTGADRLDCGQLFNERTPRHGQFRRLFCDESGRFCADQVGGGALR